MLDDDLPLRQAATQSFFDMLRADQEFEPFFSDLVVDEILRGPEISQRLFRELTDTIPFVLLERTEEAKALAARYLAESVIPARERNDALHLAMATVADLPLVLSWNFRHMVNLKRIHCVNGVNLMAGYRQVDIRSPEEVLDADA